MSEGPEVKHTVDKISEANLRKRIDNVYCKTSINAELRKKIIGSEVKILLAFSTGIYIHNHMIMWVKWRVYGRQQFDEGKAKAPLRRKSKLIARGSSNANGIDLNLNNDNSKSSNVRKIRYTSDSHNDIVNEDVRNDEK